MNGGEKIPEVGAGEELGERVEELGERGIGGGGLGEISDADFALARGKRIRLQVGESDRAGGADAHLGKFTVTGTGPRRKLDTDGATLAAGHTGTIPTASNTAATSTMITKNIPAPRNPQPMALQPLAGSISG